MSDREHSPSRLELALLAFMEWRRRRFDLDREQWLSQHEDLRDLLEPMLDEAEDRTETSQPRAEGSGPDPDHVGPYRILGVLGSGGMGTVYVAERDRPRQRVALKLIKLGMAGADMVARFENERQALALMSHDHIARVFDAGTTDRGQPFFVMEFVPGRSLSRYCDERRLPMRRRIELLIDVCSGVQHAHQKGVVHRDLKPSNILVTEHDGITTPKIIDFGIAKAIDEPLTDAPTLTIGGQPVGTPEYMSPEQIEHGADIDTRTDIYSLGVVLYELLVGELPFDSDERRRAAVARRDETEPKRPSSRLTRVGGDTIEVAARRQTTLPRLRRELRRDLDWIVLKAMERDRNRRYESAAALADDLGRYLRNEPVAAGPPSGAYRLRKFVRRHRARVIAGGALVAAVLIGTVATLVFALRAEAALAEFDLLASVVELREARVEQERLYPAWPDQIPALEAWLRDHGEPLERRLVQLGATLRDYEQRAGPWLEADRDRDRRTHPDYETLEREAQQRERLLDELQRLDEEGDIPEWREMLETMLERSAAALRDLNQAVDRRRTWRFATERERFLHFALTGLIADLEAFAGPGGELQSVRDRLQWAASVHARTIQEHVGRWAEAKAEIAASPRYGGLELAPQLGLVPIGRNPRSGLWEFYHLRSGAPGAPVPQHAADGRLAITDDTGLVFVLLPGGTFTMGTPGGGDYTFSAAEEGPAHEVALDAFFVSRYEMIQGQWLRLSEGEQPSDYEAGTRLPRAETINLAHPVENVTWDMCTELLARHRLLLPTEAQWEYACRAGTSTKWFTGDDPTSLAGFANVADQTARSTDRRWPVFEAFADGHVVHAPVGSFGANAFGLHDVHGNVSEWCRDHHGSYLIAVSPGDGLRALADKQRYITRGGSFIDGADKARSAARASYAANRRIHEIGVRPVRAVMR